MESYIDKLDRYNDCKICGMLQVFKTRNLFDFNFIVSNMPRI
jgi:hypothetical protein